MTWWEAVILGAVQGLTEFLPVSSSGHLVVAEAMLGVSPPGVVVEVVLHVATLTAVIIVYRRRIAELVRGAIAAVGAAWRFLGLLALASVPAAGAGLAAGPLVERAFDSLALVGAAFLGTGLALWSTRHRAGTRAEPSWLGAVTIGVAQALALLPGLSRSGLTIAAGMWTRVEPVRAAEFSFLMAVAAIGGAAVRELPKLGSAASTVGWGPLGVGFAVALVCGIAAIRLLVALLARQAFYRFAPYCMIVGVVTLTWTVLR